MCTQARCGAASDGKKRRDRDAGPAVAGPQHARLGLGGKDPFVQLETAVGAQFPRLLRRGREHLALGDDVEHRPGRVVDHVDQAVLELSLIHI